jgi:hypothetical protein
MLRFSCYHCGASLTIDESARNTPVVCKNCNTRQPVPSTAANIEHLATTPMLPHTPPRPPKPLYPEPIYSALHVVGQILFVAGILEIIASIFLACAVSPLMLFGIIGGFLTIGIGAAFHCLRNIALDVQIIRHNTARD